MSIIRPANRHQARQRRSHRDARFPRSLKFVLALVAGLAGSLLLVVSIYALAGNIFDSAGAQSLPSGSPTLSSPMDNGYGAPTKVYVSGNPYFCVTFEFLGVNPAAPYATFGILVGATKQGKAAVTQIEQGKEKLKRVKQKAQPAPRFENVSLLIKSNIGLSSILIPIPSSAIEAPYPSTCGHPALVPGKLEQNAAFRTTQNIPVLGQQRAFPEDWYELNDSIAVLAGNTQNGPALPSSLIMTSQDEDFSVTVQKDDPSAKYSSSNDPLKFTAGRPQLITDYTYCVAFAPFVLLIPLLIYARFINQRAEPQEVALAVAAAIVAILPLRLVLVPSSVPGITRLDAYFGLGISILVFMSIIFVIVRPPSGDNTETSGS